ncbi:glycosyltransferase [Akkermansiaceae bacterium]|nr:glycosyltransferase [Akkermansiaceae bacterium]
MKTIFLGGLYPKERLDEIRNNSFLGIDNAADNLQWALVEGLDHYIEDLKIITMPFIRNYPKGYKRIFFKTSQFAHKHGAEDVCVGFLNVIGLYTIYRYYVITRILRKSLSKEKSTTIIIYSAHSPFLKAIEKLRRRGFLVRTCLIIPDLPEFSYLMHSKSGNLFKFLKRIDIKMIEKYRKRVDSYVLLSDFMAEKLDVFKKPFVRIEGIYNGDVVEEPVTKEVYKTVLYTGKLEKGGGISELLAAFKGIDSPNYRLWIRGFGPMMNAVIDAVESDNRIKIIDELSRAELLMLQKKATILINPIPPSAKVSKFFFPSKTMDYLASGTPTVMFKLECLPIEYHHYIHFIETESVDGIRDKLIELCELSAEEHMRFGSKASRFIFEKKTPVKQVEKLVKLLEEI